MGPSRMNFKDLTMLAAYVGAALERELRCYHAADKNSRESVDKSLDALDHALDSIRKDILHARFGKEL